MKPSTERCLAALSRRLPSHAIVTDPRILETYSRDESGAPPAAPEVVIRLDRVEEVATLLEVANEHRMPVTPRGAGTGKSAGALAVRGGAVLHYRANRLIEIDSVDRVAVVESGFTTDALHEQVQAQGLFYGPDPNSGGECTLGGNIATNAAGPRSLKYGATRAWVAGLQVVTPGGRILELGRRTTKGVTGFDVASLVVGSEGTLAIVTRATLRLITKPERIWTLVVFLPSRAAAQRAIEVCLDADPRCFEFLDDATLEILRDSSTMQIPTGARAMAVIELDGPEPALESRALRLGEALANVTPHELLVATDDARRAQFWSVRREMSRALRRSAQFKLSEDIVVPRRRIAEFLDRCESIAHTYGIRMPAYGHAGDGNFHVNLLWDDPEQRRLVDEAIECLFRLTIELGGTLSGEHGLGALKAPYLTLEQSSDLIALQTELKRSFDPKWILNPGKVLVGNQHGDC